MTPDGRIRTFAGGGDKTEDGIPARTASLDRGPRDLVVDRSGNVYILCEFWVWKVSPEGTVVRAAGNGYDSTAFPL